MKNVRILLIGASGVFGSRLAEGLAAERGIDLTLSGRDQANLERTAAALNATSLNTPAAIKTLNRDTLTAKGLAGYDLVIDAAGPFQASHSNVIDAAIAARCHYADLADGREFLAQVARFDAAARGAGIAVICGASSIPALSHAVIDNLTAGWQHIDNIKVGIYPGNRAPRGLAVVQAILSYTGKPVRVFRGGEWQDIPGWGMTHRAEIPGAGKRWASVCDTPEQDLLVARYHPRQSAEFFAGLELSVLHLGLSALSMMVRWRLLSSLRPFAAPLLWMAKLMLPFGTDKGAMDVQVWGIDAGGKQAHARWTLAADTNRGPYVPTLAALILARRLRDDGALPIGAAACSGVIGLDEFDADFVRLGIKTTISKG
jgi:saccharopine dehydrogenase-like NADP-dependent oxidoreductase